EPADHGAALDDGLALVSVEGDVDPLAVRISERIHVAVADDDGRSADVDSVELRAGDGYALELRAADAVDHDPVVAADDGHVADGDAVRRADDAAAHD